MQRGVLVVASAFAAASLLACARAAGAMTTGWSWQREGTGRQIVSFTLPRGQPVDMLVTAGKANVIVILVYPDGKGIA